MRFSSRKCWQIAFFLCLLSFDSSAKKKKSKVKKESPSYISIRTTQETHTLNATHTCHGGGWLPDSTYVSCICVKGIWAVSSEYCDENTTIYTGDGHCFQINKKIKKLFNLDADKAKPFESSNYLVASSGQTYQSVTRVHQLAPLEQFSYLFRVNPKHPMFQKYLNTLTNEFSMSQCMPSVRREFQTGKTQYVYISQVSGKNHFSLGTPGWCDQNKTAPFWTITVGQSFRLNDHQITEGKIGKPESCPPPRILSGDKKQKDDEVYYFTSRKAHSKGNATSGQTQDIETIQYNEFEFRAKVRSGFDDYDFNEELRWPIEDDPANLVKLLDVQTKRLGGYYKRWIFHNNPGPKVSHVKEIAYIQFARKLFIKTCKAPAVTIVAVNNFFRWFRWIWRESLDVYSYTQGSNHKDAHDRIIAALSNCYSQASPFTVNYKKECGPPQPESVVSEGQTYLADEVAMPENVAYDISKMEASMEFMYKIMALTHHYCAGYFAGFPTDHSTLQVSFQSMFSPLMKMRWKNPGSTMRLLEVLWPTVQIAKFFDAVDICIGTSRVVSEYKEFMERPLDDEVNEEITKKSRKKRNVSQQRDLWNNLGYCIADPEEVKARYGVKDTCTDNNLG